MSRSTPIDENAYTAWLETVRSPFTVDDLLRLGPDSVQFLVARHVRVDVFTTQQLTSMLPHFSFWRGLVQNPTMSREQASFVLELELERSLGGGGTTFEETLRVFEEAGIAMRGPWVERLRQIVGEGAKREEHTFAAARLMLAFWSDVTSDDLRQMHRVAAGTWTLHLDIARHPNTPADVIRDIWEQSDGHVAEMRAVAGHPAAHEDGPLRDDVLRRAALAPIVLAHAMQGRPGEEIQAAIRRLCDESPERALTFVRNLPWSDRAGLEPAALAPLLEAGTAQVRLAAQSLLSEGWRYAEEEVDSAPPVAMTSGERVARHAPGRSRT